MIVNVTKNKKAIASNIEEEKEFLGNYQKTQERINFNINTILKSSVAAFKVSNIEDSKQLSNLLSSIFHMQNRSFFNIDSINSLLKKLNNIDLTSDDYLKRIDSYNSSYLKLIDKVLKNTTALEIYILECSKTDNVFVQTNNSDISSEDSLEENNESETVTDSSDSVIQDNTVVPTIEQLNDTDNTSNVQNIVEAIELPVIEENKNNNVNSSSCEDSESACENTLLVSEIDNKVVLPYTMEDINKILNENPNKYKTVTEVIDNIYTRPLKYYKHSSVARFKEAYNLVRNRQHGSIAQAIDLAVELFSNYNLHPAIISACKNVDELDIYLACLQYNELNDFHFFKTIFKLNPMINNKINNKKAQSSEN